ncbi:hypothetical protein PRUPE_1G089200 [Prunus persica]|uniref:Uncharacterized protein n=1 Tax=Prunus persica TaxID=3760 RepID=M5XGY9_PRUPE|nr:hypothetical protein PRUPE_1G089200 [Prunus persica]
MESKSTYKYLLGMDRPLWNFLTISLLWATESKCIKSKISSIPNMIMDPYTHSKEREIAPVPIMLTF